MTLPKYISFDNAQTGTDAKKIIFDVFGYYPVIGIHESFEDGIYEFDENIDTENLFLIPEYEFMYVKKIFEKIVNQYCCNQAKVLGYVTYETSVKYSFSDTPDWWNVLKTNKNADFLAYGESYYV